MISNKGLELIGQVRHQLGSHAFSPGATDLDERIERISGRRIERVERHEQLKVEGFFKAQIHLFLCIEFHGIVQAVHLTAS